MEKLKRSSLSLDFVGGGRYSLSKLLFANSNKKNINSKDDANSKRSSSPAWQLSDSFVVGEPTSGGGAKSKRKRVRPASVGGAGPVMVFRSPSIYEDEEER